MENVFEFTLSISGAYDLTTEIEDALFEAGCDDGLLGVTQGRMFISFSREAETLQDAILSAIANVRDSGIGLDVVRIEMPNLVTQSDIARRIGRSRQLVHQYINGENGSGDFPPPVCTKESTLWYWSEVAYWLWENGFIEESVFREAEIADAINLALESARLKELNPTLAEEVENAVSGA